MKRARKINNIYDQAITIDNVRQTWNIVKKTCNNRKAVYLFSLNANSNISNIYKLLKNKKYVPNPFTLFLIFEPKPRLVMSQNVADKIVNHFITNYYLLPHFEKMLVDCNVATRKEKGSKYGIDLLERYINTLRLKNKDKEIYCLKVDVSKYFYTINHEILLNKLERTLKDKTVLDLIKKVIDETDKEYVNNLIDKFNSRYNTGIPHYQKGVGLSIGAMSSQFLAIFYLNDLDHYIKEHLKCKYYIRYMDDFIILDIDKERLKTVFKEVVKQLEKLKLKVNPKSNIYRLSNGITFLGYRYRLINHKLKIDYGKKTHIKIKKKLSILKKYNLLKYYKSYASYYGYLKKIREVERNFTMKAKEKYLYYKEKHPTSIVMVKEGSFYKTYEADAIILWHIFGYKWNGDSISFGSTPYIKVLEKLAHLGLSYCIVKEEPLYVTNDEEVYDLYLRLATINYKKQERKKELIDLLECVLDKNIDSYDNIKNYLLTIGGEKKDE